MQEPLVQPRSRRSRARAQPEVSRASDATCSVRVIVPFGRLLARSGCDADAWLRTYGLTMAALEERDRRVPHSTAMGLLDDAMALSGDPAIGIRAALCHGPGDFDVIEYAAANCATIGESLQTAIRFIALMHDGLRMELDVVPRSPRCARGAWAASRIRPPASSSCSRPW
jgi:hypothetical protein